MSNNIYDLWKNKDGKITNELGVVDNQNNKIINLTDPTDEQDAVNLRTLKEKASGVFIQTTSTPGKDIAAKIPGNLNMETQQINNLSEGTFETDAINLKQLNDKQVWEQTPDSRTVMKNPTDIDMQNAKLINLREGKQDNDSVTLKQLKNAGGGGLWEKGAKGTYLITPTNISLENTYLTDIRDGVNKQDAVTINQITPFKTSFYTAIEGDVSASKIARFDTNNDTNLKLVYNKDANTLTIYPLTQPQTIDLFSNNSNGFYNTELNSKLNLTLKSYQFIWTFEAHSTNNEDFIHIWPNTQTIIYNANQQTIQQKGGSFIILNINGVYRIKKESSTNKTKRLVQMHFFNNDGKYQIFFLTNEGNVIWLANLVKEKQIRIAQHQLIIKEIK